MDKNKLFKYIKTHQKPRELIKLLDDCYSCMKIRDIKNVFGHIEDKFIKKSNGDGKAILKKVQKFQKDSLQGVYYAPFDINSKNFMNIPEETDMWFENLAEFLTESSRLSMQCDHVNAVKCFEILFELIDKMCDEIVFADELGIWMLPIKMEPCITAYFKSAAAILNPKEYAKTVLPVIRQDSCASFCNKAYEKANRAANTQQKIALEENIIRNNIRVSQKVL